MIVVEASAVLALILDEPGGDIVLASGQYGIVGSLNLSEVITTLLDRGVSTTGSS